MPDDREQSTNKDASEQATVAVAGVLFVGPLASGPSEPNGAKGADRANGVNGVNGIWVGPAAGWRAPRGIHQWERELSFVARARMTPALAAALRATLPVEQIAPKRFPMAAKAAAVSPHLAMTSNLAQAVQEQGVRVHTIGVDRVSGDFFYFEEGGDREPVRAQGSLVDMLGPSLGAATTNAEIAVMMDGLLDRLLLALSEGEVSELDVELADALPRLSRDGTGLVGTDLDAFEAEATALAARAARWETAARQIPEALAAASRRSKTSAAVPLFGEAVKMTKPALDLVLGGKPLQLSPQPIWTVRGAPRAEDKPAAKPAPSRTPSPAPARVAARPEAKSKPSIDQPKVETKRTPSPSPARVGSRPDLTPAPVAARPRQAPNAEPAPASPAIPRVSDRPPASPRAGTKPTPLKTPVPPRPATEAPLAALALALASAPAPVSAPASAPEPASASAPPPAPASAPEPAPESEPALPLPIVPSVASSVTRAPTRRPSATLIVVMFALLAIAYVALKSFGAGP
jgi:hypothetical protein